VLVLKTPARCVIISSVSSLYSIANLFLRHLLLLLYCTASRASGDFRSCFTSALTLYYLHSWILDQHQQSAATLTTFSVLKSTASSVNMEGHDTAMRDAGENGKTKLLDCAQRLMTAERSLSSCLKRNRPMSSSLRTPSNRTEVDMILAVARSYSNRTSAPQNWDPSLPVIHFTTPNPLPHQLRSGTLASMQLKLSRSIQKRATEESGQEKVNTNKKDAYDPKRERIHKVIIPAVQGPKNPLELPSRNNIASMNLSDSSEDDYDEDDESN